jgi:hypothetical protein
VNRCCRPVLATECALAGRRLGPLGRRGANNCGNVRRDALGFGLGAIGGFLFLIGGPAFVSWLGSSILGRLAHG